MTAESAGPKRTSFEMREGHVFRHTGGKLHSENDEPAVIYADGTKWWYKNGHVHRETGPAVVFPNGTQEWWQDNKRHRAGDPAVIYPDSQQIVPELRGVKQWWVQGILIREDAPLVVQRYRTMVLQARKACFGG